MTFDQALGILKIAASAISAATGLGKLYNWLRDKAAKPSADPNLVAALAALAPGASADEITQVVESFFLAEGGNVSIAAGDNGGGSIYMEAPTIVGGSGSARGGGVSIRGGDGGKHGSGGDMTIIGGTIKGGDAL